MSLCCGVEEFTFNKDLIILSLCFAFFWQSSKQLCKLKYSFGKVVKGYFLNVDQAVYILSC